VAGLGGLLILASSIMLGFYWSKLPGELPWLYSQPWGEKQLIDKIWFGGFLIGLGGVFGFNCLLSFWLIKKDEMWSLITIWFSLVVVIAYLASFYQVLKLIL